MRRSILVLLLGSGLVASGCVSQLMQEFIGEPQSTTLVPPTSPENNPPAPPPAARSSYAPAAGETALRVDMVGRKILAANPQAGLQPLFITVGSPQPELFHRGASELYITEGLVRQCATEGQLAAVLCHEMGKMVAEREALAAPDSRNPERPLPPDVPFGNAGQVGAFDQVREAEIAKLGPVRRRVSRPLPPPDPRVLSRQYMKNANYPEADLEAVAPFLDAARNNYSLEKQMKSGPPPTPVSPPPAWSPAK
jgi:hypothetical protein